MSFTWNIIHKNVGAGTQTDITAYCQNFNYSYGRRFITDPFTTGTGEISGINPGAMPEISVGDQIWFNYDAVTDSTDIALTVTNYSANYYPANLGAADRWTLSLEDALAEWGRGVNDLVISAGDDCGLVVVYAAYDLGIPAAPVWGPPYSSSKVSAQTWEGVASGTILTTVTLTEQAYIRPNDVRNGIIWLSRGIVNDIGSGFTGDCTLADDNTVGSQPFQELEFAGIGDDYYTGVQVNPDGLTVQQVGDRDRMYIMNTIDETESQALNLARYVKGRLVVNRLKPRQITTNTIQWSGTALTVANFMPGSVIFIKFRGTTYGAFVEGGNISATPEETVFTATLSDLSSNRYLILNSNTFGQLDVNRLGF